ncbi:MAG: HAD domain-containing protein [Rickettsiales bacterium]
MSDAPEKIIFLDIDGVLATIRMDTATNSMSNFDPVGMAMLNRLCAEAPAKIVITSTWADDYKFRPEKLLEEFRAAGFAGEFHEDWRIDHCTNPKSSRGPSIVRWAEKHGLDAENALIVDDKVIGNLPAAWKKRFVKTDTANGITHEAMVRMEAIFLGHSLSESELRQSAIAAHPDLITRGTRDDKSYRG